MKLPLKPRPPADDPDFLPDEAEKKLAAIPDGPELLRIIRLPRRPIPDLESAETQAIADMITDRLAKVPAPYPGRLRPVQGVALMTAWEERGLFAPIVVGGGKMLTCYLMPVILKSLRPIYVCPAKMSIETAIEFKRYRKDWHGPSEAQLPIVSYELLGNPSSEEVAEPDGRVSRKGRLERMMPDLIVLDEGHMTANARAAVTLRIRHYLERYPSTVVAYFSGTPFKDSIEDAIHCMEWCLGDKCPLPRAASEFFKERKAWAGFLDPKQGMLGQVEIGMLPLLADAMGIPRPPLSDVSAWRRIVAQRILETPGVVGTQDAPLDVPLTVTHWLPSEECDEIHEAMETLASTNHLPDGTEMADSKQLTRHLSTMGLGFWQKWVPEPPEEWRKSRNEWGKWCRNALRRNRKKIVSEATMKYALRRGTIKGGGLPILERWEAAERLERERTGLREPPSIPQWISDEAIEEAGAWVDSFKGLIWVQHIGLGQRLASELKIPYYGGDGGLDVRSGLRINQHRGGPAVASVFACGTGKNLQHFWHQNLWMTSPGEQALARTHRPGQKAASVDNWIYLGGMTHFDSFERAKNNKAKFADDMTLSPQKLRYALTTMPTAWELEVRGGVRWARKLDDEEDWDDEL